MKYDAVILAYRRPAELLETVRSVRAQDAKPDELIIFHNDSNCPDVAGAINVRAGKNFGCRARQAIGLLCQAPVGMFVDDDVILRSPSVAGRLLDGLGRHPASVVGYVGMRLRGGKYSVGQEIKYPAGDCRVDVVKGRLHMAAKGLLAAPLELDLPADVRGEDDIVLNAAAQMRWAESSWVIGGFSPGDIVNQRTTNGQEHRPDHLARRDAACRHMLGIGWLDGTDNDLKPPKW